MDKKSDPILFFLILIITFLSACQSKEKQSPNIIFFLVDDMGWQDTSVPFWSEKTHFNELYRTPNMERLAAKGMVFTQAYAYAVCSPSRTSLMTGMNAARHRVTNWTLRYNTSTDSKDSVLQMPSWNVNGLQAVDTIENSIYATPLPQILKNNGYYTIHAGKAHWGAGGTPGANPLNLGFDVNIAGHEAGAPASYQGENNYASSTNDITWNVPGLEKYHGKPINITDALTLEAIEALNQARGNNKPFYLYMAHYTVHVPLEPHHPYFQKYKEMGLDEREARYASMVEGMDNSLGQLMDYLEENGMADNTIILFMSDNGGLSAHARGGEPHTHNWPLKSGKGSAYEGGTRVPMIVSWPGKVQPGSKSGSPVIIEDFFPSILEIAGIQDYQPIQSIDGKSFVPNLKQELNQSLPERSLIWHYPNKWGGTGPGIGSTSTIRKGDWKLIYWYKDQKLELYNLTEDIHEENNLASQNPEIVRELAAELGDYLRSVNGQRPNFIETGNPAPWPDEIVMK
ncbi:sulfatase [Algoriphagus kandeliae]|uniref:Sulfatase n=1 Tax=Algoriphagus kandeliae TaxID=2562278 RepID=A0A4Y9QR87_9BACT|nr:sulfatase [Algoriphagus kandeliae]TFV94308.1 sulfatase [Algoriphagus kandeliae]